MLKEVVDIVAQTVANSPYGDKLLLWLPRIVSSTKYVGKYNRWTLELLFFPNSKYGNTKRNIGSVSFFQKRNILV